MSLRKMVTRFRRLIWPKQAPRPTEKQFLTVGLLGGLLDYTQLHLKESDAEADADRIAKNYGIDPKGEVWHDEDDDVYVVPVVVPVAPLSPSAWRFFLDVWLEGMKKVRLTDGWSSDDRQRDLDEVDQRLLMLKPRRSSREVPTIQVRFVWDHEYLGPNWTREQAIADAMESVREEVSELSEDDFQVTVN